MIFAVAVFIENLQFANNSHIDLLETEEKVRRSSKSGTREVYYQYLDAESCKGALHMSCIKCGKTFHMADGNAALLAKHLAQSEKFMLDTTDTILYGTCSDCKGK